jgi:hypothetical protein
MHYIIFPIGDWSCDGHSCYADFLVKSTKPLQEVREVHFKENNFIGSLCKDYQDNKINVAYLYDFLVKYIPKEIAKEKIKQLIDNGVEIMDEEFEVRDMEERYSNKKNDYKVVLSFEEDEENPQSLTIDDPEIMLDIWLLCLNAINPSLELEKASEAMSQYMIKYKGYPHKPEGDINFYGVDKESRHLDTPGYGVWDDHCGEFYHDVN